MIALLSSRARSLSAVPPVLPAVLAAALPAMLLGSVPLLAQKSDVEIRDEIEFARGLAADWSFVDLAEDVIREVEDEGVTGRMGEQLGLVKCDVYAIGARNERDPVRRNELFEGALTAYHEFIDNNPFSETKAEAEAAFVDTSAIYARAIELALEEALGDEATRLRERQGEVLTDAVKLTQDLISALEAEDELSEIQNRQLHQLMLDRGTMLATIGRSNPDNPFFFNESIKALEDLVFLALEGTPSALRAFVAIGDVYAYQGMWDEAWSYYEAVIEQTIPTDPELWAELKSGRSSHGGRSGTGVSQAGIALRFLFLELATEGLMEASLALGRLEEGARLGLHLYNIQRQEGVQFTAKGYLSLLAVARVLLESGGYLGGSLKAGEAEWFPDEEAAAAEHRQRIDCTSAALQLAQQVNDENKRTNLQIRAQKLISEISTRPGMTVAPDVLLQAAQGEYHSRNFPGALQGFRRVLSALDSREQAERIEYGAQVMNFVANAYRKMGRPLEAAMAFREGCTTWRGDVAYDAKNAEGYYAMIGQVAKRAVIDKQAVEDLVTEAEDLVAAIGTYKQDEVLWKQGKKAARAKNWDAAEAKYREIAKGADYWEKAFVEIGVCLLRKNEPGEALKVFDDYVENVRDDADNATTVPTRLARRKEASATAEFYRGFILFSRGEHARVVVLLGDFHRDYPEQDQLANYALDMVMRGKLEAGDVDGARTTIMEMVEIFPDTKKTKNASIVFYGTLREAREVSTDPDEWRALTREMAQHLARSNRTGAEFQGLRNESKLWFALGEFDNAKGVLLKIRERYAADPERADDLRQYVDPDLGAVLLGLGEVADAREVLAPLVMSEEHRAPKSVVVLWARSIAGWLEGEGSEVHEVAGAGGSAEEYQEVINRLDKIAKAGDKWISCDWYEQKLMIAYTYYSWSKDDSRKKISASNQIKDIENFMDEPDFAQIDGFCNSDETDPALRERLGAGVLQSRFRWMSRLLR